MNCELVGSWTVEVGDLDQALHLWQYTGGYERIDHAQAFLSKDEVRNILSNNVRKDMVIINGKKINLHRLTSDCLRNEEIT